MSVTSPLLVRWGSLRARYLSGRSPVLVRYASVQYSSREPRAAAVSTFTNGRLTDKSFWQIFHPLDVRSRYPVRCDWAIKKKNDKTCLYWIVIPHVSSTNLIFTELHSDDTGELVDNITQLVILARQDECLESYCRTPASVCACTKSLTLPITHELLWLHWSLTYF